MIGRKYLPQILIKAHRVGARSYSSGDSRFSKMSPAWLQAILGPATKQDAPKMYAWTLDNLEDRTPSPSPPTSRPDHHDNSQRRVYILGVGNLGSLFATSLASLPEPPPVTLVLHRKDLLLSWRENPGIEITRRGSAYTHLNFDVELWSEEPPRIGQAREVTEGRGIHNLIVATKASQALPEVDRVRRYLDENSTIAFAQNGMCKLWPPHGKTYTEYRFRDGSHPNWLACVTTHGVTSLGRFKSVHASEADIKIGPVYLNKSAGKSSVLSDLLSQAPNLNGRSVAQDELWVLQLEKLVVNSVINPLTAILRCKNGELFSETEGSLAELIDVLLLEASNVLRALIKDQSTDAILQPAPREAKSTTNADGDRNLLDQRLGLLDRFSQSRLKEMLYDIGYKVRENTSSMLQDVRAGKQTEINEFNGWLVETAGYLDDNLDTTHHQILVDLVRNNYLLDRESLVNHFPCLRDSKLAAARSH
ncbi:Putative 6-phosphogluconate dehydrogenase-like domain superfamily, ketopantoate reductase [Colletotrichum destructivum]|uniref:6-phosphogluconate dehydrogenase-like domain superfamily, ketopantoate reductase n=1 Tax=Colletotrichum destructivum TaxID=34406 RepID=A0AAX4HW94_9PEZI|nr:Putative 6-phosphogluconate dehydrogenase-like domain superfamily, ketopantoate reductase [Colletotrichum destructivum]